MDKLCQCLTEKGIQCHNKPSTKKGADQRFCWIHQNCKKSSSMLENKPVKMQKEKVIAKKSSVKLETQPLKVIPKKSSFMLENKPVIMEKTCQCLTAKGIPCRNKPSTIEGSDQRFCWMHQKCKKPVKWSRKKSLPKNYRKKDHHTS
jgi:hypothetical protein